MRTYEIELKVSGTKAMKHFEDTYKAELTMGDLTSFSDILKFMEDTKSIWRKGIKALKDGNVMEMEVIDATYDDHWNSKSFDRWVSVSNEEQGDSYDSIYLRADERYTDPCRDMFLTKDVLHDMGLTLCY